MQKKNIYTFCITNIKYFSKGKNILGRLYV